MATATSPSPSKTYKKVERRGHPHMNREDGQKTFDGDEWGEEAFIQSGG